MNIQRIDSQKSNTSFGMLRPSKLMTSDQFNKLSKMPVISNFSNNFDGEVSIVEFIGSKTGRVQYALAIDNIVPQGLIVNIRNFLHKRYRDHIMLKTHATNFDEFLEALSRRPKKILTKMFFNNNY